MRYLLLHPSSWQPGGVAAILEGAQVERRELRLPRELAVDERPTVLVLDPESRSLFPLDVPRAFVGHAWYSAGWNQFAAPWAWRVVPTSSTPTKISRTC